MTYTHAKQIVILASQMPDRLVETAELRQAKAIVASGKDYTRITKSAIRKARKPRVVAKRPEMPERPEIGVITKIVCDYYGIAVVEQIKQATRTSLIKSARQIVHYLVRTMYSDITLREIGEATGGKDTSTIIHSIQAVKDKMDVYPEFKSKIEYLKQLINEK